MRQVLPGNKMDNFVLQPQGRMCQTHHVSPLSGIYPSHSAKGFSRDFIIDSACQGSAAIENQIISEYTIGWNDRIYRLASIYQRLMFS